MNRQNFFFLVALLFVCNTLFAQTAGGIPVELKPWNPIKPPEGNWVPIDTTLGQFPFSLDELLSISSNPIFYKDIPSFVNDKYIYRV